MGECDKYDMAEMKKMVEGASGVLFAVLAVMVLMGLAFVWYPYVLEDMHIWICKEDFLFTALAVAALAFYGLFLAQTFDTPAVNDGLALSWVELEIEEQPAITIVTNDWTKELEKFAP